MLAGMLSIPVIISTRGPNWCFRKGFCIAGITDILYLGIPLLTPQHSAAAHPSPGCPRHLCEKYFIFQEQHI